MAEETKEGFSEAKTRYGCGCFALLIAVVAGAYFLILWLSTQTS